DLQSGVTVDEMHHPVMRSAETEYLEFMVGIADEIAVGGEQQLDDIPAQTGIARGGGARVGRPRFGGGLGTREVYVSHIDVSWVQCSQTISRDATFATFC